MIKIAVAGTGKMALDVANVVDRTSGLELICTLGDPLAETRGGSLALMNRPHSELERGWHSAIALLKQCQPDYLLSVNNFRIIPKEALSIPTIGTLNFHNGPLPRYAGLNPCSWAILRGEKTYGVTWHYVEPKIDTGSLVEQVHFEIAEDETALELVMSCIEHGLSAFSETIVQKIIRGELTGARQIQAEREYFSAQDVPYSGNVPWWLPFDEVDRYVRALSFAPLPNMFFRPKIETEKGVIFECEHMSLESKNTGFKSGLIVSATDDEITIAVEGGLLILEEFRLISERESQTIELTNQELLRR